MFIVIGDYIMNILYIEVCPFCGKIPAYDEKTQLVHCKTLDCALGDYYIHIDEWNYRYNKGDSK